MCYYYLKKQVFTRTGLFSCPTNSKSAVLRNLQWLFRFHQHITKVHDQKVTCVRSKDDIITSEP